MSIGIGACLAEKQTNSNIVNGSAHLLGIRSVNFVGATGEMKFSHVGERKGGRIPSTTWWAGFNLFPPQPSGADLIIPYTLVGVSKSGRSSQSSNYITNLNFILPFAQPSSKITVPFPISRYDSVCQDTALKASMPGADNDTDLPWSLASEEDLVGKLRSSPLRAPFDNCCIMHPYKDSSSARHMV